MTDHNEVDEVSIINSERGNKYLISKAVPKILFIHPHLDHIIHLKKNGNDSLNCVNSFKKPKLTKVNGFRIKEDNWEYYDRYFEFLKHNSYFKTIKKELISTDRYTGEMVRFFLANTDQMVFETTSFCNMDCVYCGYGKLYREHSRRVEMNLSEKKAKNLIDFFYEFSESDINRRIFKKLIIGFYGGEPLLNFKFIEEIVDYINNKKWSYNKISFRITTNGILLDEYMEYLVEKRFNLVVSLDGNEQNNAYRISKNGSQTYQQVMRNIMKLKSMHPSYFEKYVDFNAVIHTKNSLKDVMAFFRKTFCKVPKISEISKIGIETPTDGGFHNIYKKISDGFESDSQVPEIAAKYAIRLNLLKLLLSNSNYIVGKYSKLFNNSNNAIKIKTGTCPPFKRKIFCTAEGKLLPCERIPRNFYLGEVDEKSVHIDYHSIAHKYNRWYAQVSSLCNRCYNSRYCSNCIFHLNLESNNISCQKFKSEEVYNNTLKETISELETSPHLYLDSLGAGENKVQPETGNGYLYWLFLHPYALINVKKNWTVIYNTLNGAVLEFRQNNDIHRILNKLNSNRNLYVVGLKASDITPTVEKLIKDVRKTFTGDIVEAIPGNIKPFQFKPIFYLEMSKGELTFESRVKLLEGDEIPDYLHVVSLYVNNQCRQKCSICDTAYKQFICCNSSKTNPKELHIESIKSLLQELVRTSVYKLNVMGGNIFEYKKFAKLVEYLNTSRFDISYYIHYLNLWESNYNRWLGVIEQSMENELHILFTFPIDLKSFDNLLYNLERYKLKTFFHFIIENQNDLENIPAEKCSYNKNNFYIHPLYNGRNLSFFRKYVFVTKKALEESKSSMKDVFARTTLNTLDFGKLTVMSNAKIYANVNNRMIGRLGKVPIIEIIKNEMIEGRSWGKIRKYVLPCKCCPYNAICPPISGYEYVLGSYCTCNIWKNSRAEEKSKWKGEPL